MVCIASLARSLTERRPSGRCGSTSSPTLTSRTVEQTTFRMTSVRDPAIDRQPFASRKRDLRGYPWAANIGRLGQPKSGLWARHDPHEHGTYRMTATLHLEGGSLGLLSGQCSEGPRLNL